MKKLFQILLISCVIIVAQSSNLYAADDLIYKFHTDIGQVSLANGKALLTGGVDNIPSGEPAVGYKIVRIVIPQGTRIDSLSINAGEPLLLSNNAGLEYAAGDTKIDRMAEIRPSELSAASYASDSLYPLIRAAVLYSGYWGNIAVADLAIYPLAYRPKSGRLELFNEIKITIKLSEISPELSSQDRKSVV
jgi:hypothetical protein